MGACTHPTSKDKRPDPLPDLRTQKEEPTSKNTSQEVFTNPPSGVSTKKRD
jgi:hypothetical protein